MKVELFVDTVLMSNLHPSLKRSLLNLTEDAYDMGGLMEVGEVGEADVDQMSGFQIIGPEDL